MLEAGCAEGLVRVGDGRDPLVRTDRTGRDVVEVGVELAGVVVARHRARAADSARVESDDVVARLEPLVRRVVEAVLDEVDAGTAGAARVHQQRTEAIAGGGGLADQGEVDGLARGVGPVQRRAGGRALQVAARAPDQHLVVVRLEVGGHVLHRRGRRRADRRRQEPRDAASQRDRARNDGRREQETGDGVGSVRSLTALPDGLHEHGFERERRSHIALDARAWRRRRRRARAGSARGCRAPPPERMRSMIARFTGSVSAPSCSSSTSR